MQFADLAFGQREQPHPGEPQPLQESGDVFLVARQAVEGLGDDDVELAAPGIFEQGLVCRTQSARPADRPVGIGVPTSLDVLPCARPMRRGSQSWIFLRLRCVSPPIGEALAFNTLRGGQRALHIREAQAPSPIKPPDGLRTA